MSPRFRVHPGVEVVRWRALNSSEQKELRRLTGQDTMPGVLRPRAAAAGTVKVVDEQTLELLESLPEPAVLPGCASLESIPRALRQFVLDGILEIELDGSFVSGPAAAGIFGVDDEAAAPGDSIAALSLEAIRYAESLPIAAPRILSGRLYGYNTVPCSPKWKDAFKTTAGIAEFLGIGPRGVNGEALAAGGYEEVENAQWFAWTRRSENGHQAVPKSGYKLYVNPRPRDLPQALARVIPELASSGAVSLKVGRSAQNLLRPDKCVVYFHTEAALRAVAGKLREKLAAFRAQGVPFTSALTADGMLSWGMDPPRSLCLAGWAQAPSWRSWIANRIAVGLLQAKSARPPVMEPWRFVIAKLFAEGIDTRTWFPSSRMWGEE
jgi:hypothetical protein